MSKSTWNQRKFQQVTQVAYEVVVIAPPPLPRPMHKDEKLELRHMSDTKEIHRVKNTSFSIYRKVVWI